MIFPERAMRPTLSALDVRAGSRPDILTVATLTARLLFRSSQESGRVSLTIALFDAYFARTVPSLARTMPLTHPAVEHIALRRWGCVRDRRDGVARDTSRSNHHSVRAVLGFGLGVDGRGLSDSAALAVGLQCRLLCARIEGTDVLAACLRRPLLVSG
jgi:hypothetical protein